MSPQLGDTSTVFVAIDQTLVMLICFEWYVKRAISYENALNRQKKVKLVNKF